MARLLPSFHYPSVVVLAFGQFTLLRWLGVSLGRWLLAASCLYGAIMAARLVLGATILRDVPWFARPVPTVFHLVLAAYLGVCGRLHVRHG